MTKLKDYNKVIRGYKKISKNNKRFYTINATKSIILLVNKLLKKL